MAARRGRSPLVPNAEPQPHAPSTLLANVRATHGRDTCDDVGRPLSTYTCDYHQGYEDGLERLALDVREWLVERVALSIEDGSALCRILDRAEGHDAC